MASHNIARPISINQRLLVIGERLVGHEHVQIELTVAPYQEHIVAVGLVRQSTDLQNDEAGTGDTKAQFTRVTSSRTRVSLAEVCTSASPSSSASLLDYRCLAASALSCLGYK